MEKKDLKSEVYPADVQIFQLPWEVLQEIFLYLDGRTLINCKRVCKSWKNQVNYIVQKTTFWYESCQKEIPSWVQFDLLDSTYPLHWLDQNSVDWQDIYKCWYTWKKLNGSPLSSRKFVTGLQGISSIQISGDWLLISTCEGRGKLIAQNLHKSVQYDMFVCGGAILNFELVNSDGSESTVTPKSELEEIFNTLGHNEIWLELDDCYIKLGKSYHLTVDKVAQQIRHSYGFQVTLFTERSHSYLYFKKMFENVSGPIIMEVELPRVYSEIMEFWQNKITIRNSRFSYNAFSQVDTMTVNMTSHNAFAISDVRVMQHSKSKNKIYTWHGAIFIIYTELRQIMFQVKDSKSQQTTSPRKGCITAVLVYANYVFLGSDRGQLLIYRLECVDDCLSINVYESKSWTAHVANTKIIHIAVAEQTKYRKNPIIVCASPEDVYLMSVPDFD